VYAVLAAELFFSMVPTTWVGPIPVIAPAGLLSPRLALREVSALPVTAAPDSTEKLAADPKLTDVEYTPSAVAGEGTDSNPMASNTVANPAKVLFIKDPRNWRLGGRKQGTVGLRDGDVAA
jgi:hypothetical protein